MTTEGRTPVEVFYSYSREDESFLRELEKHLSRLRRQGLISEWYDRKIVAGMDWEQSIITHLSTAQIILLLISPDFMASDYCYGVEMKRALERYERGEAHVIPLILRPVDWQGTPLGKLQALPTNGIAVTEWSDPDAAFLNIAKGIQSLVTEIRAPLPSTEDSQLLDIQGDQSKEIGIGEHAGTIIVHANEKLRGKTVDLYLGFHSKVKLHATLNVVEKNLDGQKMFLAVFPSLKAGDYTVSAGFRYYARVTVFANRVTEIDWR